MLSFIFTLNAFVQRWSDAAIVECTREWILNHEDLLGLSPLKHAPEVRGQTQATIFTLETAGLKPDSLLLLRGRPSYLSVRLEKKKN